MENTFSSSRRHTHASSTTQIPQHTFVVVFGYPADKFSLTAEYFKSLGEATEPEKHLEITNCFRIGYVDIGDAMRAVRKNGEVFNGSWMIGAKWAVSRKAFHKINILSLLIAPFIFFQDSAQAEAMIGQPVLRSTLSSSSVPQTNDTTPSGNEMLIDEPHTMQSNSSYSTVGTPIKLAPSTSAFRKQIGGSASKPTTPQTQRGWAGNILPSTPSLSSSLLPSGNTPSTPVGNSPNKSVVGHVTDLIFGW